MSIESDSSSVKSNSDSDTKDKSGGELVEYSKKNIFLYDKKCRTVLQLGVLYRNLSKAATNSINLDKITHKIQSMINKNQIYLRDVGPIILGITKIVVKKTFFLYKDIEELTNLRISSKDQSKVLNYNEDNSEIKEKKNKNINIEGKKLLGNDKEQSTLAMNINSLETDGLNYQNNTIGKLNGTDLKNRLRGNKYTDLTFSKDIIELANDDMIRRTIQKMSKLDNTDIKDILSTNKKKTKEDIKFDTENKNSKTLKNLRDLLLNKGSLNNTKNLNEINLDYSANNSVILDNNNQDVNNFFTVVKSQIANDNNVALNDENNYDFDINMDDFKNDNYFLSNKKFNISKEEINNNLKSKINKKPEFMQRNAKLKYDDEIKIELNSSFDNIKKGKKDEIEKQIEAENLSKLKDIQFNSDIFLFDKNKLTGFTNEKYEYLLPQFLEAKDDEELNNNPNEDFESNDKTRKDNNSSINSASKSSEKNDISRAERFTTSNKKRISLGNFDSNANLMNNLSRLSLDQNDFKGAKSFIEKLNLMEKDNKKEETNINNDIDLVEQDNAFEENNVENEEKNENINFKEVKTNEEIKEEEDAMLLKEDLEKNVFSKNKKKVTFDKIREKLENKEKFEETKLFYDLLLLAQKGDVEITQKELMKHKTINVSLIY